MDVEAPGGTAGSAHHHCPPPALHPHGPGLSGPGSHPQELPGGATPPAALQHRPQPLRSAQYRPAGAGKAVRHCEGDHQPQRDAGPGDLLSGQSGDLPLRGVQHESGHPSPGPRHQRRQDHAGLSRSRLCGRLLPGPAPDAAADGPHRLLPGPAAGAAGPGPDQRLRH